MWLLARMCVFVSSVDTGVGMRVVKARVSETTGVHSHAWTPIAMCVERRERRDLKDDDGPE